MLAWDVASDAGDVAVAVCDLVDLAVVIGGDGALVPLGPSIGAGVGALHISSRYCACSRIKCDILIVFMVLRSFTLLLKSLQHAWHDLTRMQSQASIRL